MPCAATQEIWVLGTGHKSGREHAYVVRREFCIVYFDLNQMRQKIIRWPVASLGDHDVEVPAEFLERFRARRVVSPTREQLVASHNCVGP